MKPFPFLVKWGPWSDWSSCSRLCDAGVRHRSRSCLNGNDCVGQRKEQASCLLQKCPREFSQNYKLYVMHKIQIHLQIDIFSIYITQL